MSLLRHDNVTFYHPLDDYTEYIQNHVWNDSQANVGISGGVIVSGMINTGGAVYATLGESVSAGGYSGVAGATRLTTCFWASGFYQNGSDTRTVLIGYGSSATNGDTNILRLTKSSSNTCDFRLTIGTAGVGTKNIPTKPSDNDKHFVVLDAEDEGSVWRYRISFDGADWQDLGTLSSAASPTSANSVIIHLFDNGSVSSVIDEVVFWSGASLFSAQELSNLYELANTYGRSMDEYSTTFGTLTSGSIDQFTKGYDVSSGNLPLYIPGQKEVDSIALFASGSPTSISDTIDLYMSGSVSTSSSGVDLFILPPVLSSGNVDLYEYGFDIASGETTLYIAGLFPSFDAFVSVDSNTPTTSANLFIYGFASGSPTPSYVADSVSLYINDSGNLVTVNKNFSGFVHVDDPILTSYSGIWSSFVKVGNSSDKNCTFYMYGHASGESPHGTLNTNDKNLFVRGRSAFSGDEGLLFDNYIGLFSDFSSFAKVHLGTSGLSNLYVSGYIPIEPPSGYLDFYVFGISGITFDSIDYYISGKDVPSGDCDLFMFGIQGIPSGSVPFYLAVTTLGDLTGSDTLYTHGF